MNTLRCIIVDDEPLAIRMLENYIGRTPFLSLEASFTDPVKGLEAIRKKHPHIAFLDIQMPDIDGLELSRRIPTQTRIIFTTAFKQYAFDSYEVNALDFLLKPIRYQKFLLAAEKASSWFGMTSNASQKDRFIFIKVEGDVRKVALSDILYVSGMKDYVLFYLESSPEPSVCHMTMKAAEDMLPHESFMRVHRSFIVALDKISSINKNCDISIGKEIIHVSESYRKVFSDYLRTIIEKNS